MSLYTLQQEVKWKLTKESHDVEDYQLVHPL